MRVKRICSCLLAETTPYFVTKLLLDPSSINYADSNGDTALNIAVKCKRFHLIRLLVQVSKLKMHKKCYYLL